MMFMIFLDIGKEIRPVNVENLLSLQRVVCIFSIDVPIKSGTLLVKEPRECISSFVIEYRNVHQFIRISYYIEVSNIISTTLHICKTVVITLLILTG